MAALPGGVRYKLARVIDIGTRHEFRRSRVCATGASAAAQRCGEFGRKVCYYDTGSGPPLAHLERGDGPTIRSVLETLNDPREKLDAKLGALRMPVLLVWGGQDAIAPLAMAHAWRRMIANARLETIANCGHFPPLERPAEFARAVTEFLRM